MSNRYEPDYPVRERGSRDSGFRDLRSRDPREQGRFRDSAGRRDDPSGQMNQRPDDDYSASDYRSWRNTSDEPYEGRNAGSSRYTRQDPEDEGAGYSGSPYYGAGYTGPGSHGSFSSRDSGRYSRLAKDYECKTQHSEAAI